MLDDESKFIKACRNYDINTIISLQNKININVCDIHGYTGFLWACKYRFKEIVNILIKNDKLDVNIKNNEGYTALIIVCCYNFPEILKILLTHKDIDVNVLTNHSYTGFIHSCFYGNTEIIELLLNRKDLNILNKSNNDKTGFSIACIRSHYNIVKLCESGLAQFCRAKLIIKSGRLNLNTLYLLIDDIFINICLNHDYEMLKILISIGYIIDKKIYKLYNDILKFSDDFIKSNEYFKLKYELSISLASNIFSLIVLTSDDYYVLNYN